MPIYYSPNFNRNAPNFPNARGPGPIPKNGSESPALCILGLGIIGGSVFLVYTGFHEIKKKLPGIFLAILGRGPRAFLIGKVSDVNPEFGKFSEYSKLIIFCKLT